MIKKMKIALVAVGILSSCMMFAQATDSIVKSLKPNLLSVKLEEWQQNAKMAEGIVSPDGSTKSARLSRKTSGDNESQLRTGDFEVKPNVVYTLSVYAKAGTPGTKLNLRFIAAEKPDSKPADTYVAFNLENGTVSYSGTLFKAAIEPKGNGWYLCSITGTALDGPNKLIDIQVTSKGVCGGNEDDFIYVWNARLE